MIRSVRALRRVGVVALAATACVAGGAEVSEPVPTLFPDDPEVAEEVAATTLDSSTSSTTTVPVIDRLPPLAVGVDGAVRAADGTARAITGTDGEVWFVVGACSESAVEPAATADLIGPHHVVLDPGSGEAELNLDIAERTASLLRAEGVLVVLTREREADLSSSSRGAVGPAVGAQVLVSIHHPAPSTDLDTVDDPRPAVFHQAGNDESRRLAGLLHEEISRSFAALDIDWTPLDEPGVKPLLNQRGDDYFVVLQSGAGVPAVHLQVAALGGNEATLLATEEGRAIEAQALADALIRFLVTTDQGSGFIEPAETIRTAPTSNTPRDCGS